ncbi:hypothetical protein [Microbacterium sp. A84]|uniref:hypothetical protein n=1 Tax=Microbacterium sp. A84 TaxID=3450715 RepID=UPI003F433C26
MNFFPPDPEMPDAEDEASGPTQPPWWAPPEDELPALLAATEIIATTAHIAVALIGVGVYREGVEFRLERRLRRNGLTNKEWNEWTSTFMENWSPASSPADRMRFGLVLGDGERVFADYTFAGGTDPHVEPAGHTLARRGGAGGGGSGVFAAQDSLWLWPAPPEGPIELVMQWPEFGIDERRIFLDGSAIRALASQARPLWD